MIKGLKTLSLKLINLKPMKNSCIKIFVGKEHLGDGSHNLRLHMSKRWILKMT